MGIVTAATDNYQKCIDACRKCAQACDECFILCLNAPDVEMRRACINTLADCSVICGLTGFMMGRGSQFSKDTARLCAVICDKCAMDCAMFQDDHCVKCAVECRACSTECKAMGQ